MCKRLNSLVKEKNLWYRIDTRSTTSNTLRKIKYCLDKVNEHTEHLLICGEGRGKVGLSVNKFMRHSYPNLTVLALENQLIYKEPVSLNLRFIILVVSICLLTYISCFIQSEIPIILFRKLIGSSTKFI